MAGAIPDAAAGDGPSPSASPVGLIWAQARDASGRPVIGADGGMPWHVPEDLAHFKRTTMGRPVVVGRRTWDSFPVRFRPLPGRTTVVVTRTPGFEPTGDGDGVALVRTSVEAALVAAFEAGAEAPEAPVWIAGGAQLFDATLAIADRACVTELDLEVPGDTFAPRLGADWTIVDASDWATSRTGVRYRMVDHRRAV